MNLEITRRYEFSASHQLSGLRPGHKCMRNHGHNYAVEITVAAPNGTYNGLIIDAGDLDVAVGPVIARLDHHLLNEIDDEQPAAMRLKAQPSVENLALYFSEALHFLSNDGRMILTRIRVHETPRLWADVILR